MGAWLVDKIVNPIAFFFFSILWTTFVALPYVLLEAINFVKSIFGFGFIRQLFFGKSENFEYFNLPWIFLILSSLAIIISLVILCYIIFKNAVSFKENNSKEILKQGLKTFALILLMPIIYFISLLLLEVLNEMIRQIFFSDNNLSEMQNLFVKLKPQNVAENEWLNLVKSYFFDVETIRNSWNNFAWGDGFQMILMFLIIIVILAIFQLWMIINLGKKIIIMYIYMVISPVLISLIMADNEKEYSKFKSEMKSSLVSLITAEFFFNVFFLFIIFSINFNVDLASGLPAIINNSINFIFKIVAIAAGCYGVKEFIAKMEANSPTVSNVVSGAKSLASGAIAKNPILAKSGLAKMASPNSNSASSAPTVKENVEKNKNFSSIPQNNNWNAFKNNQGGFSTIPTKKVSK
ncbi:Mbov_0396 family ICE element transmembrane protein [Mesomycoplasma lagogenitalium]|uniref:Conjugal transfer protein TrbL n=1 Tax=Mesomycoplasma lagogenitalium TaxID=171286 RepID=A0ABY8LTD8_9BACT|nr:hypothetical protein [Mesomycoplasma lagogenitalium]WGI36502.1 hypothetical protein QEG99_03490 [Mesomycoplasma lagogenitalium]